MRFVACPVEWELKDGGRYLSAALLLPDGEHVVSIGVTGLSPGADYKAALNLIGKISLKGYAVRLVANDINSLEVSEKKVI